MTVDISQAARSVARIVDRLDNGRHVFVLSKTGPCIKLELVRQEVLKEWSLGENQQIVYPERPE